MTDWPWPTSGGSYLRDPQTGALTRRQTGGAQPSVSGPPPAPASKPEPEKARTK